MKSPQLLDALQTIVWNVNGCTDGRSGFPDTQTQSSLALHDVRLPSLSKVTNASPASGHVHLLSTVLSHLIVGLMECKLPNLRLDLRRRSQPPSHSLNVAGSDVFRRVSSNCSTANCVIV